MLDFENIFHPEYQRLYFYLCENYRDDIDRILGFNIDLMPSRRQLTGIVMLEGSKEYIVRYARMLTKQPFNDRV